MTLLITREWSDRGGFSLSEERYNVWVFHDYVNVDEGEY